MSTQPTPAGLGADYLSVIDYVQWQWNSGVLIQIPTVQTLVSLPGLPLPLRMTLRPRTTSISIFRQDPATGGRQIGYLSLDRTIPFSGWFDRSREMYPDEDGVLVGAAETKGRSKGVGKGEGTASSNNRKKCGHCGFVCSDAWRRGPLPDRNKYQNGRCGKARDGGKARWDVGHHRAPKREGKGKKREDEGEDDGGGVVGSGGFAGGVRGVAVGGD